MIEMTKQIKRYPQTNIHAYENEHDWDSAVISPTIQNIEDYTQTPP